MLVGNNQVEENIYDAFTSVCIEMQKAPIFYPAVSCSQLRPKQRS
jgi:hypothetical protein